MDIFEQWLEEERSYLQGLSTEPIWEMLEMEYLQKLTDWKASQAAYDAMGKEQIFVNSGAGEDQVRGSMGYKALKGTVSMAKRQHTGERKDQDFAAVCDLEERLGIEEQWTPDSEQWVQAESLVGRQQYQWCLDELEALVVSHMFELMKMNMSQTGYKLCQYIAKALSQWSKAVKTALDRYNSAAKAMKPLCPTLKWEQVIKYVFLTDFDLLCESHEDIHDCLWSHL
ncbi:hypothetical protein P691DRAFT_766210 [Macrolepiota fuliginosa MF-IS2]|uniref:Uncharacterized protein n=1 Tax=Macrolepiota fuliginosa MF-IS2 TaxID=1400762 RepID=A0A9P6BW51_9AGAR|nr:hypothetical protein P691DRAFT_766210 [Macrolepiota fuliginosa MF-IS2]